MPRFIPYPLLSLAILAMWLLLSGFTLGQFVLGGCVALFCGLAMTRLKQRKIRIYKPYLLIVLLLRVLWDIILSNLAVAKIILNGGRTKHPSGFITLQLSIENRVAVSILAGILTATPGTVWIAYSRSANQLLLHILDLGEENYWHNLIKKRYEAPLLEIFK